MKIFFPITGYFHFWGIFGMFIITISMFIKKGIVWPSFHLHANVWVNFTICSGNCCFFHYYHEVTHQHFCYSTFIVMRMCLSTCRFVLDISSELYKNLGQTHQWNWISRCKVIIWTDVHNWKLFTILPHHVFSLSIPTAMGSCSLQLSLPACSCQRSVLRRSWEKPQRHCLIKSGVPILSQDIGTPRIMRNTSQFS